MKKKTKNVNENDKPSIKSRDHYKPIKRRFSVEMSSVHENSNAHEEFRRFRLLLCSPIVQPVATFCTNGQETVLTPLAFRDIRRFARDLPSGSHGVAARYRER